MVSMAPLFFRALSFSTRTTFLMAVAVIWKGVRVLLICVLYEYCVIWFATKRNRAAGLSPTGYGALKTSLTREYCTRPPDLEIVLKRLPISTNPFKILKRSENNRIR